MIDYEAFKVAVSQNDFARLKTIHEEAKREGGVTWEKLQKISEEAKMWLRHLDFIYHRTDDARDS